MVLNEQPERKPLFQQTNNILGEFVEKGILNRIVGVPRNISTGLSSVVIDADTVEGRRIIKLRKSGALSENLCYEQWRKQGVPVPHVYSSGHYDRHAAFGYLIMDPVLDFSGNLAKLGYEADSKHRNAIEQFLGMQLAKMHQAKSSHFGGLIDDENTLVTVATWNDYINYLLEKNKKDLLQICGVKPKQFDLIRQLVYLTYSTSAVFVHGDFGIYSILIRNTVPVDGVIFDPDSVLGDPYYDVANHLVAKWAWSEREIDYDTDPFLNTYVKTANMEYLDQKCLAANQALAAISHFVSTVKRKEHKRAERYKTILFTQLFKALS